MSSATLVHMSSPIHDTVIILYLGLPAFMIEGSRWRALDRSFLRLKQQFYRVEMSRDNVRYGGEAAVLLYYIRI